MCGNMGQGDVGVGSVEGVLETSEICLDEGEGSVLYEKTCITGTNKIYSIYCDITP